MRAMHVLGMAAMTSVGVCSAAPTVILQTNFESAAVTSYANGNTINESGAANTQLTMNISGAGLTARVAAAGGSNVLQFIDTAATAGTLQAQKSIAGVSTNGTGESQFRIEYDVTPLAVATGSRGTSLFALTGTAATTGSHTQVLSVQVNNSGTITYYDGTTGSATSSFLTLGTKYHVLITADLRTSGTGSQDIYSLKVTNTATGIDFLSLPSLKTRGFDTLPTLLYFSGGTHAAGSSSDPFVQYDNISITSSAVPEPATASLAGGVVVLGLLSRRRRAVA